ncbi:UNVERIFIED_CONTAM: hypothetical protein FKN15_026665 [Acipenser sinensis]
MKLNERSQSVVHFCLGITSRPESEDLSLRAGAQRVSGLRRVVESAGAQVLKCPVQSCGVCDVQGESAGAQVLKCPVQSCGVCDVQVTQKAQPRTLLLMKRYWILLVTPFCAVIIGALLFTLTLHLQHRRGHLVKNCPEKESRERDGSNGDETADKQKPGPAGAGLAGGSVPAGSSEGEQASDGGAAEPQEAGSDAVLGAESQTKAQDTAKDNESAESHGTEGESEKMDTETVASVWGDVQIQVEGVKFAEDSEVFRLPGKKRVSKTEGSAVTKKRSVSSDGSSVGMEPGSSAETCSAQAVSTVTDNPAVDSDDEGSITDSWACINPGEGIVFKVLKISWSRAKGIDVEDFFADIDLFLSSVQGLKQNFSAQETFNAQELVRLKYISSKLRGNVKHSQS